MKRKLKIALSVAASLGLILLILLQKCMPGSAHGNGGNRVEKKNLAKVQGKFISPFSNHFNVKYTEYLVPAGRDTIITHISGTRIRIPSCAFLKNGVLVKGPVKVKYREMMNPSDIIASGVPMKVTENSYLETTGMMEFTLVKGEEQLNPSADCKVKFEMVNTSKTNDVNLYYLDTIQRNWIVKVKNLPANVFTRSVNKTKRKDNATKKYELTSQEALLYFIPAKPKVLNPSRFGFHFKIDLSKYPEVNVYDGIVWEYAGAGGGDDPRKHPWVENAQWKEMYIFRTDKKEVFRLKLISRDKTFETLVRPVFEKEDMEYAMDVFNDRYSKYRNFIDKKKEEERKWRSEQDRLMNVKESVSMITRTFEIDKFGIWNCDRIKKIDDPVVIALQFSTGNDSVKIARAYLIDKYINSVFSYDVNKNFIDIFKLQKGRPYKFIVLDNYGRVHLVSTRDISSLYTANAVSMLNVLDKGEKISSMDELRKLL